MDRLLDFATPAGRAVLKIRRVHVTDEPDVYRVKGVVEPPSGEPPVPISGPIEVQFVEGLEDRLVAVHLWSRVLHDQAWGDRTQFPRRP